MRRLATALVIGAAAFTGAFTVVPDARAECIEPCGGVGDDEGGEIEPVITTLTYTLSVTPPPAPTGQLSGGTVTGAGISCTTAVGADCSEPTTYTCTDSVCPPPVSKTLSATGPAGYEPVWSSNCAVSGTGAAKTCTVEMSQNRTVSLSWVDTQAPSISLASVPSRTGPESEIVASASDNDRIKHVDFYVDGVFKRRDQGAGDGWRLYGYEWITGYVNGSSHTITAIATDRANNLSALSSGASTTVDKQVSLALGATPVADSYVNAPSFAFSAPDSDVVPSSVRCAIVKGSISAGTYTEVTAALPCVSPYVPSLEEDGQYEMVVSVYDDVGNSAVARRMFTLDRLQPALSFTDGPAEGGLVASATFMVGFAASDASPLAVECSLDGGAYAPCNGSAGHTLSGLAAGSHTLDVRARDAAGNQRVLRRNFAVAQQPSNGTNGTHGSSGNDGSSGGNNVQAADTSAPLVTLAAKATQRLKSKALVVSLTSNEGGIASAKATYGKLVVGTLSKTVTAGKTSLKLKLSKKAQAALAKALKKKKILSIKVVITVRDLAGNAKPVTKTVKLTR